MTAEAFFARTSVPEFAEHGLLTVAQQPFFVQPHQGTLRGCTIRLFFVTETSWCAATEGARCDYRYAADSVP